jgi:hypothetical protein
VGARLPTVSIWCRTSPAGYPKGPNGSALHPWEHQLAIKAEWEASPLPTRVVPSHHHSHPVTPHQWPTTQWRVVGTYMTLGKMTVVVAAAT